MVSEYSEDFLRGIAACALSYFHKGGDLRVIGAPILAHGLTQADFLDIGLEEEHYMKIKTIIRHAEMEQKSFMEGVV